MATPPPIPEKLRERYEKSLAATLRWQGAFWPPDKEESDYDHVVGIFQLLDQIKPACPNLFSEVDLSIVKHMIYIHDGGEIPKSIGDLAIHSPDYEERRLRHKSRERYAFELLTRRNVKSLNLQKDIIELYGRCVEKNDRESRLTSVIDKMQGNRYAFDHVYHRLNKTPERQIAINLAVGYIRPPIDFLTELVSERSKVEIVNLYRNELQYYSSKGYGNEVRPYLNQVKINPQVV